eukprot:71608_1
MHQQVNAYLLHAGTTSHAFISSFPAATTHIPRASTILLPNALYHLLRSSVAIPRTLKLITYLLLLFSNICVIAASYPFSIFHRLFCCNMRTMRIFGAYDINV